jgi:hypothetical protein
MTNRNVAIGILLLLLGSIVCGCIQEPSKSLVTDDISFDEANRTQGNVEFVNVAPDGTVVLKYQDKPESIMVRPSEYTTLSQNAKVIVIASNPQLQTATIRMSVEKKGR